MAHDPGLNQLILAVAVMAGIGVTIGITYLFVHATKAMWIEAPGGVALPAKQAALLAAQHRGVTLLSMILGGLIGMMAAFAVVDPTPRGQAKTMLFMPIPLLASMALAIEMTKHHVLGLVVMALVMAVGTYARKFVPKFGSRAFLYGILLFVGYLFGFLSRGAVAEHQLGWVAAVLWLAVVVNFVLKAVVFAPLNRGVLGRTSRSFVARCRAVVAAAAELHEAEHPRDHERARRRLLRRMTRLNETALVIDALLADEELVRAAPPRLETHHRLFETELVLHNLGRLAEALDRAELPTSIRADLRAALVHLRDGKPNQAADDIDALAARAAQGELAGVAPHEVARIGRLATAIADSRTAIGRWPRHVRLRDGDERGVPFESAVTLLFGNLPGSALVSAEAAAPSDGGTSLRTRLKLDPPAQVAIRIGLAVGAAAALGSILSERRFYWAVIAVFIAFMGANTSGEQVTKAFQRVAGTVVGIGLGSVLAHAIGTSTWSIAVIIVSLGVGVYFIRVNYAMMVIGVTVMVSQLYEQLGEYSNHLLVLRLEETAIGAAVAMVAALVVFPVRTRHAVAVATRQYLTALGDLLALAATALDGAPHPTPGRLTGAARALDHAAQQLTWTARPLARRSRRRADVRHGIGLVHQASHHARNVIADLQTGPGLDAEVSALAARATHAQQGLAERMERVVAGDDPPAAPQLVGVLDHLDDLPPTAARLSSDQLRFIRHVDRLDETLAELDARIEAAARDRRVA